MLEPIDDEIAMSPCPCTVTITDVSRSGTEVPPARMVIAKTRGSPPVQSATTSEHSTISQLNRATAQMERMNVIGYKLFWQPGSPFSFFVRTSGMILRNRLIGKAMMAYAHCLPPAPASGKRGVGPSSGSSPNDCCACNLFCRRVRKCCLISSMLRRPSLSLSRLSNSCASCESFWASSLVMSPSPSVSSFAKSVESIFFSSFSLKYASTFEL
mmetsp:Transcript_18282/g.48227  ORF Transcript_18282/g.48227 Transcript_18282/m.48227 type:complete len:213 (-) Transcript_18282:458-1096(-)